jgi:hypothetical protein
MNDLDVATKLLETLHLNVSERRELPNGVAPFSLLVRAADAVLTESHFVPSRFRPGDHYTGVIIERRGNAHWVHERHEIGVNVLSPVRSTAVPNLAEAVLQFISVNGGNNIDGVVIDFKS